MCADKNNNRVSYPFLQEGTAPLGGGGGGMAACEPGHTHTPSLLPNHNHKQQKQSSAAALHSEWGEPPTGLVHKDSTSLMPRKSLASLIRPHSVSKLSFSSSQQDTDGAIGGLLATFDAEAVRATTGTLHASNNHHTSYTHTHTHAPRPAHIQAHQCPL